MGHTPDSPGLPLSVKHRAGWVVLASAALFAAGYLFFRHPLWAAACSLPGLAAPRWASAVIERRRKEQLALQFQQMLYSLSSSLHAGRSLENAVADAAGDMLALYPEPRARINAELARVLRRMANGAPVEQALLEFGRRSGLEDIRQFAEVLAICKRQGGNMAEAARNAAQLIQEKLDMQRSIQTMTAQKRWEARVLAASPFAVVAFLSATAGDYMAPLYSGSGRLLMLAALLMLCGCFWLCAKITDIRL